MTLPLSTPTDLSRRSTLASQQEAPAMQIPTPSRPIVSFQDVTKSYGSFTVLDHLNLDVAPGEKLRSSAPAARANPPCCGC